MDLLCRLLRPGAGSVTFAGRRLDAYTPRKLAQNISLMPQDYGISFPFTVREIVMMGRHPHMGRFSSPTARDLDLTAQAMDETATDLFSDRLITDLSGGERQRVVFARMLAQDTPVMLLDEPTANLDVRHALDLLDRVADRVKNQGRTAVVAIQDVNLAARYCQNLIILKKGKIAAHGPTKEVLDARTLKTVFEKNALVRVEPELGAPQVIFK